MRIFHSLLVALVLFACVQHGRADTLSDAANAAGSAVDTAVDGVKSGASSAWEWTQDTAGTVGDWFSNLGCTVTDFVDNFDLEVCNNATEAVPCPAGCANELKKLSSTCLGQMVDNQANKTAAAAEVRACGLAYNGAAAFTSVAALAASFAAALAILL